jgi:galactokinase
MTMSLDGLQQAFAKAFNHAPDAIFFAPGRINLIGEHTDHTGGYALPASIELGAWMASSPRDDGEVLIHSINQLSPVVFSLNELLTQRETQLHWGDYVKGVAQLLGKYLHTTNRMLRGMNACVFSTLPFGGGLSSSASLEVVTALSLLRHASSSIPLLQIARLCQQAENEYVGARCGLLDQFIALHGQADSAIQLDCHQLTSRTIPLPQGAAWLLCNSMVKHSIADSGYNQRRAECEQLEQSMRRYCPDRQLLRELDDADIAELQPHLSAVLKRRLAHVVSENRRVAAMTAALEAPNLSRVGELLNASHASLRDDFEVSCTELDLLTDIALRQPGVLGSRMMGGGFGGCTLNLIQSEALISVQEALRSEYQQQTGVEPWLHVCRIGPGAHRVA